MDLNTFLSGGREDVDKNIREAREAALGILPP